MSPRRRRSPWSRRRTRASGGDGAVIILIGAAIAVAALGVYLLVIGAIAFVGWLVAVAAKREASPSSPAFVAATTASTAPPPNQHYHVVLPVRPGTFDDAKEIEATASSVFAAWARQLPKAPSDPRSTLRRFTLRKRAIGRLTTRLDGRRFVWRTGSYQGRDRGLTNASIDPSSLDPYNPPSDLRTRSTHLSLCRGCGGDGRIECTSCGGSARVTCIACEGAGKVMGITANGARRMLNCKTCKGKSSLVCHGCSKGRVDCAACQRSGRLEHWLELEGGPRDGDVQVEPDGDVTRAFVWGKDGVSVAADEIARDARVICAVTRDRTLTLDDLPAEVPSDWRNSYWQAIQARLHPGERVVSQTFTLLEVPSIEVEYAVGKETQSIELEGLRMLAPPISADHLFASRASALRRLAYALASVPIVVGLAYLIRGSYFYTPLMAGVVACSAVAAAVIYGVFWYATLRGGARKWLAGAIIPVAAATTLAFLAEPSEAAARRYIAAHQLDLAKAELNALGEPSDPSLVPLWDDIYLVESLAAKNCTEATHDAARMSPNAEQRAKAVTHADALALEAAEQFVRAGQLDDGRTALECASEPMRAGPSGRAIRSRISMGTARRCMNSRDWSCVFAHAKDLVDLGERAASDGLRTETLTAIRSDTDAAIESAKREKDLMRRVQLRRSAAALWTQYLLGSDGEPTKLVALKAELARDEQTLAKQEEVNRKRRELEEKRAAAAAQRKREAEERAEKRRLAEEARRERASIPRSLRCCDGSLSPSCLCGGSRRGCCSHHGGVCGCE